MGALLRWKAPAVALAAGIALGVWLGRATIAIPKEPTPPATEVGRPIPGEVQRPTVPTPLVAAIPTPSPDRTAQLAEKYGDAYRRAAESAPKPQAGAGAPIPENTTAGPNPAPEPPTVPVFPLELAEKRVGPGPLGDEADVLALLPCPGCPVDLLARWLPPAPKPQPLIRFERRWFVEGGLGFTDSGYGALVGAGYDFARISRATVGLRGHAILSADPAGFVGLTFRWGDK